MKTEEIVQFFESLPVGEQARLVEYFNTEFHNPADYYQRDWSDNTDDGSLQAPGLSSAAVAVFRGIP